MDKYFFLGFAPCGRAEFIVIKDSGVIEMLKYHIPEVYSKLINKNIPAVNLSKEGIPAPPGFPAKRW